jgi:galactose mutarotase-like enzyme
MPSYCWARALLPHSAQAAAKLDKRSFGKTRTGATVDLYTLTNANGMEVSIMNYGATIVSLKAPDRSGKMADVVLGFDSMDGYLTDEPYFGAVVGRYGNRIAKGKFKLNGKEYSLATNNGPNALHGGIKVLTSRYGKPNRSGTRVCGSRTSARTVRKATPEP